MKSGVSPVLFTFAPMSPRSSTEVERVSLKWRVRQFHSFDEEFQLDLSKIGECARIASGPPEAVIGAKLSALNGTPKIVHAPRGAVSLGAELPRRFTAARKGHAGSGI